MQGVVEAGGERPSAIRLGKMFVYFTVLEDSIISHDPQSIYAIG
jgi:hypothetical protein